MVIKFVERHALNKHHYKKHAFNIAARTNNGSTHCINIAKANSSIPYIISPRLTFDAPSFISSPLYKKIHLDNAGGWRLRTIIWYSGLIQIYRHPPTIGWRCFMSTTDTIFRGSYAPTRHRHVNGYCIIFFGVFQSNICQICKT